MYKGDFLNQRHLKVKTGGHVKWRFYAVGALI